MRWPKAPVLCNKRDIDASFKRIRIRPDVSAVLRAEFNASLLRYDGPGVKVAFLYLALPFGRRAVQGYISKLAEGVAIAHREYAPNHPNRDGAERFDSQLFVHDAISIEPNIGCRKEMAISFLGIRAQENAGRGRRQRSRAGNRRGLEQGSHNPWI